MRFLVPLVVALSFVRPEAAQAQSYAEYVAKYAKADSGQKVELGAIRHAGKDRQLIGYVTKPNDAPKQPAVVYMGGCNGFDTIGRPYMAEHLTWLREEGYVVLLIDSLTPRGITKEGGYCDVAWSESSPLYISSVKRAQDAMIGLEWLSKQPYVDPDRIGLFGFSAGANASFSVAVHYAESFEAPRANTFDKYKGHYKAIFAIYPRCFEKADYTRTKIRTDTMIVLGELDTSSKPEWCKPFSAVEGIAYNLMLYPGVYHSYMQPLPPREIKWADGSRHWFAPNPAAKADTIKQMKAWFAGRLR